LAAIPGIVFSGASEGEQLTAVQGGHHGYDPNSPEMYTGFIAAGRNINKGVVIPEIKVYDIAPLIAKLLGLDFHTADGVLVPGIIK
jgi:predicted AlkP superfamily pyrophosphatase or phosphodiesterase